MKKEEFDLLPDNEKRVTIAKDVLLQLNAGKIKTKFNSGYLTSCELNDILRTQDTEVSLQRVLPEITCTVCAMGALFVADVTIRNDFYIGIENTLYSLQRDRILEKLTYFSKDQLEFIEAAFENYYYSDYKQINDFCNQYPNKTNRMIAIMENIIENKGEFVL